MSKKKSFRIALAAVLATVSATLLVLNLSLGNKYIDARIGHLYAVADAQFERAADSVLGPPLVGGNRAEALRNGDQIFPAMLDAIRAAQRSITFESYIYWDGAIGAQFSDALREKAASGIRVHVLLDWIGGRLDDALLERMRAAGVEIRRYNPPRWYSLGRLNSRTHRRLLVVDGRVGFTGGVGLADHWTGHAQDPEHWRDTHFRVEGSVVAQLQSAFLDNWLQTTGEVLHGDAYLPPLDRAGAMRAQVFSASAGGNAKSMQLLYLLSIAAAARSIEISAAYFVPDEVAVATLVAALGRGVRLRILVPGPYIDREIVRHASRAGWGPLLEAGAEIHEYQPTMFHCKVMVVDALWVTAGSTNFDSRSFSINDEVNMNVLDAAFAERQIEIFDDDLKRAKRITLDEWRSRPWYLELLDRSASWLDSQL